MTRAAAVPPGANVTGLAMSVDDPRVIRATEEYAELLQTGPRPDRAAFLVRHADIADILTKCLDGLEFLRAAGNDLSRPGPDEPADGADLLLAGLPLGDYQLIRELGRGGMGVVYEAEQLSLGRRVAVKVLPFAATMDGKQLQRFKNEARAAASLHHEHIVPVYGVGCDRGVHYYAMQLIEGASLADHIAALRPDHPASRERQRPEDITADYRPVADAPGSPGRDTAPIAALSTVSGGRRGREFYRTAARLFADAADALEYAHSLGIVHRDVKPGNLLVATTGRVWVTDFGLARFATDAGLTMTGDLVGTLRYMAPEQAMARHGLADHRVDVYGLGCTLYELLSGRPAVGGTDKADIVRHIAFEDPVAPRKVDRAIPMELETISLKCLAKNPNERYAGAGDLAADLRRWLSHQTIRAKTPSLRQRAAKWARRHRPLVGAAASVVLLTAMLLGSGLTWVARDAAARRERTERDTAARQERGEQVIGVALTDMDQSLRQSDWPRALEAARRAHGLLAGGAAGDDLRQTVDDARRGLELVAKLEEVRLEYADTVTDRGFDYEWKDRAYGRVFQEAGVDVDGLRPEQTVERIPPAVRVPVAAALEDWAMTRRKSDGPDGRGRRLLLAAARAADPDEWRGRMRQAAEASDRPALALMAAAGQVDDLPAASLARLGAALRGAGTQPDAVAVLRRAHRRYPGDFWINFELALGLTSARPEESVRFYTAAVALRPRSMGVHNNLGNALLKIKDVDGAVAAYLDAIRLMPDETRPQDALGRALAKRKDLGERIAAGRAAVRLNPADVLAHLVLGIALRAAGDRAGAVAAFRDVTRLAPGNAAAHTHLGRMFQDNEDWDGAVAAYREAARLKPTSIVLLRNLGNVLRDTKKDIDRAAAVHREAIRLNPDDLPSHIQLASDLYLKGDRAGAAAAYGEAIRLRPDDSWTLAGLGRDLEARGDVAGADAAARVWVRLKPGDAGAHSNLGGVLFRKADLAGSEAASREALRLNPDDYSAHLGLGNILSARGDWAETVPHYRAAARLQPNTDWAQAHFAHALRNTGDWPGGIAACREWLRHCPATACHAYVELGTVLRAAGDRDGAAAAWRDAVRTWEDVRRRNPNDWQAYHALARILADCGDDRITDPKRAVELARRGVDVHEKAGDIFVGASWVALALAHYRAGDWPAAATAATRAQAVVTGQSLAEARLLLALALARDGDRGQAREWHAKASRWLDEHPTKDPYLGRLRAEAEELLDPLVGPPDPSPPHRDG